MNRSHTYIKTVMAATLILCSYSSRSQCTIDFTYTNTDSLYQFTNTSVPLDTGPGIVTWSVQGPGITYQSTAEQPSFYFPINGTYIVILQVYGNVQCGGYKIDTITVSGLSNNNKCYAALTYYPTDATQFQFNDASTSDDSIVCYRWYGCTPDSFLQVAGWTQNTILNMWSYNRCRYPYYIVSHTITTLTGCQSTVTDTLHTYCASCHLAQPTVSLLYDSIQHEYFLSDSSSPVHSGFIYWQISVDDTVIFSQESSPHLCCYDTVHSVCVNLYDTSSYCTVTGCDTFHTRISPVVHTGITPIGTSGRQLSVYATADSRLIISYTGSVPAHTFIYDIEGRLLLSPEITGRQTTLDASRFASGSYIIRLSSSSQPDMFTRFYVAH